MGTMTRMLGGAAMMVGLTLGLVPVAPAQAPAAGTVTRVEVRVGSEITGTLSGPDGTPIPAAVIRAIPQAFGFGPTTTGQDGHFKFVGQWVNVNDAYYRWELSRPADGQLTRGKNEDARS